MEKIVNELIKGFTKEPWYWFFCLICLIGIIITIKKERNTKKGRNKKD